MYSAELTRNTKETQITAQLTIGADSGQLIGSTGIGFFDHMLNSFCVHGKFLLQLNMTGDLNVDCHHTVEDVGIVMGRLFTSLREQTGAIKRYGHAVIPMDEALAEAAVDVGGRPFIVCDIGTTTPSIGSYDTQMTPEFFRALAFNMSATLHVRVLYGENDHHKTEAAFKAAAYAVSEAFQLSDGGLLSAKGVLE